jgi:predicted Zn-dependent protease
MLYAETDDKAMNQINIAINLLEKIKTIMLFDYLTYMSDIYIKQNKPDKALEYASRSLKLAQNTDSRNK